MPIELFDTLDRKKKPLKASDEKQYRFYCCGPTVYGPAHIGNFRTFLLQDVLHRTLKVAGFNPYHVRNITDVDDKTIRQSQAEGKSLKAFTEGWTEKFHADCEALNMVPPHVEPKATDHIQEQVDMIAKLVENGHAYASKDGSVYFKVSSCKHYGELSNLDTRELQTQTVNSAGDTNDADEYDRESVTDFALWKSRKPEDGENFWSSPWGEGRPGWHIECSAMSIKYLGNTFDLHGGGVDLCFPHHENEIAQTECATGERGFSGHWFHSAHLLVDGGKMSKSLGNFFTLSDLEEKGFCPAVVRYALLSGHYRQQLNLTENGLKAAQSALTKLSKTVNKLLGIAKISKDDFRDLVCPTEYVSTGVFAPVWDALCDDLNVPAALGELFTAIKNLEIPDASQIAIQGQLEALGGIFFALGIDPFAVEEATTSDSAPDSVKTLAQQRWDAKQAKNWAEADRLRDEVNALGWKILDSKEGFDLEKA